MSNMLCQSLTANGKGKYKCFLCLESAGQEQEMYADIPGQNMQQRQQGQVYTWGRSSTSLLSLRMCCSTRTSVGASKAPW